MASRKQRFVPQSKMTNKSFEERFNFYLEQVIERDRQQKIVDARKMCVEKSMQQSMRKQMQYAVKSFATRALDEWILDYPQQVILTTLNLVLTNEI